MSLTEQLKDSRSPIRAFLDVCFFHFDPFHEPFKKLGPIRFPAGSSVVPQLVGMALDYRVRFSLEGFDIFSTTAALGSQRFPWLSESFLKLANGIEGLNKDWLAQGGRTVTACERNLLKYCYVLALYETLYRSENSTWRSPLFSLKRGAGVRAQLALVPERDLTDLLQLTDVALQTFRIWVDQPCTQNPSFKGSQLASGADADLIVAGNLIEIKATKQRYEANWIRQVLVYALLDFDDEYEISEVSIYLARWGELISWELEKMVRIGSGDLFTVATLRESFRGWLLFWEYLGKRQVEFDALTRSVFSEQWRELANIQEMILSLNYPVFEEDRRQLHARARDIKQYLHEMEKNLVLSDDPPPIDVTMPPFALAMERCFGDVK